MWTVCITSIRHVLKLKGYGEPQAKANEKRQRFKGWETLVNLLLLSAKSLETASMVFSSPIKGKLLAHDGARGFLDDVLCFFYWAFLFPTLTHSRNKVGTALARIV